MINKEEEKFLNCKGDIEFLEWFIKSKHTETYEEYYQIVDNSIKNIIFRVKELEEIEKEHQKINGELQKKVTYYEELCKGKSIQKLGTSDLYKED